MSMQDRMKDDADWKEGMNAFREETRQRMLDLFSQINELELIIEELTHVKKSKSSGSSKISSTVLPSASSSFILNLIIFSK